MAQGSVGMVVAGLFVMCVQAASQTSLTQGKSVQFDPGFPYYQGRSAESVAREIDINGYKTVRYIVTNDDDIRSDLIDAFHKRGMLVWYQTFGNGFYGNPPKSLPKEWPNWKSEFIGDNLNEGYTFLSLSHPEYRKWKASQIVAVLRKYGFDGVEIAEPFQMGWSGPEKALYGDFCKSAMDAFKQQTGYVSAPDFRDASSPNWYKTDTKKYQAWCDFRVSQVNGFLNDIHDAINAKIPKKPFSVWMLANTSPEPGRNPADLIREWQGIDGVSMAKVVKPDLVCFQTNWPDWSNPILPGDYPNLYKPFIEPFKKACPKIPVIVQADTGSLKEMRRGRQWIDLFEKTCSQLGVGSTYYMYDISLWLYTEKPEVRKIEVHGNRVLLVFQKRIDPAIEKAMSKVQITPKASLKHLKCDGNLLWCEFDRLAKGTKYRLSIDQVGDDAERRLYKDFPALSGSVKVEFKP